MKVTTENTDGKETARVNVRRLTIELANGDKFEIEDHASLRVRSCNRPDQILVEPWCSNVVKIHNKEI